VKEEESWKECCTLYYVDEQERERERRLNWLLIGGRKE